MRKFVDLFCGGGGMSMGAKMAGLTVSLAFDSDQRMLNTIQANHDNVKCIKTKLADNFTVKNVLALLPEGDIHVHMSPPCQGISRLNTRAPNTSGSKDMMSWCFELIRCLPEQATWTIEQVNSRHMRELLDIFVKNNDAEYDVFNFAELGLPQTRKRIIVSTKKAIELLRKERCYDSFRGASSVLRHLPKNTLLQCGMSNRAVYTNGVYSGYRPLQTDEFCRPIDAPTYTITTHPLHVITDGVFVRNLRNSELASLQGFPCDFIWPEGIAISRLMIANAIPPTIAVRIIRAACGL